jgi:hypothetical protein
MSSFIDINSLLFYQELQEAADSNVEVKFVHHAGHLWKLTGIENGIAQLESPHNVIVFDKKLQRKEVPAIEIAYI